MLSRRMKVVKELSFLIKPNADFIDLNLNLLQVREPFNTRYGFMCRFSHIEHFFTNDQDKFVFLNMLYRVVYGSFLFESLKDLRDYIVTFPEEKDAKYHKLINDEIISLVDIEMLQ